MAAGQGALFDAETAPLVRRARRTTEKTLAELRRSDRLTAEHSALVGLLRSTADLIDRELGQAEPSPWTFARLVQEWRALHTELRGQADSWDAQVAAFFDGQPPLRDAPQP